jgi:hypothetical protein
MFDEELHGRQQMKSVMCRFVFCRQRSDERLKRGGEQKSVAVLSSLPYSSVLTPLSQHAGPLYFNKGPSALQQVRVPYLSCIMQLSYCSVLRSARSGPPLFLMTFRRFMKRCSSGTHPRQGCEAWCLSAA